VRAARYGARLTQEQLAHASGVSVRTIVDLERGKVRRPRMDTVRRIAQTCGLTGAAREDFEEAARAGYWRARAPVAASSMDGPTQLPADVVRFTGRSDELARLDAALAAAGTAPAAPVIVVLSGMAGVGKTTLAVHWAHRLTSRFPDGQLYADLRGFDHAGPPRDPDDVVRGFLGALDVPPERTPADPDAREARYRGLLAGRRILLLLDNARDAAQVRPLLPGTGSVFVVVTSRDRLVGLVAGQAAHAVPVGVLDRAEARRLFIGRIEEDQVAADPAAADEIVTRCAGLPLALAVAAARIATGTTNLTALAGELRGAGGRLEPLAGTDPATDLRTVLATSFRALDRGAADLLRRLGLHPGADTDEAAAASLAGRPVADVRPLLATLVQANLLNEAGPGRYTRHDLLRAYTAELAGADPRAGAARLRLLDHLLHTAHAADRLVIPARDSIPLSPPRPGVSVAPLADRAAALAWFAAERPTLVAAVRAAADAGHDRHAWQLAWATLEYLDRWGHWADAATTHEVALPAAERLDDTRARAFTHRGLGRAYGRLNRLDDAETHLRHAAELFERLDTPAGTARTHLSLAGLAERRGDLREALHHATRALELFQAAARPIGVGNALNTAAWYHSLLGDHATALTVGRRAVTVLEPLGDSIGLAGTWDTLGAAHHGLGAYIEAAECYRRALRMYRAGDDRYNEAATLDRLGDTYHALGDLLAARHAWSQAAVILTDLDDPARRKVRTKLTATT
jgi:tetratricopeptide (TPR) repeat protein/transcriptional regulator with XRE-family HTH domain